MKVSELISAMMAAGAPMEAIMIAVRAIEEKDAELAAIAAAEAAKRAKDAERKRVSRSVHGQSTDSPRTVHGPPYDNISTPGNSSTPETANAVSSPKRSKRVSDNLPIPDDWTPAEFAEDSECRKIMNCWPPGKFERTCEHFVSHHKSKGTKSKDWQMSWKTWVLNSVKFDRGSNGPQQQTPTGMGRTEAGARAALARRREVADRSCGTPSGASDAGDGRIGIIPLPHAVRAIGYDAG